MLESLIVRAIRYQWRVALSVFLCGLLIALATHALMAGTHGASETQPATTPPLQAVTTPTPAPSPASAITHLTPEEQAQATRQMQRWRAGARYIDARIEEAHAALYGTTPTANGTDAAAPNAAEAEAASATKEERSGPPPPSAEELALRKAVAEKKHRLEELRAIDTEAHPDVIEAVEDLRRLEAQLAVAERTRQSESATDRPAKVVTKPAAPRPAQAPVSFETQQQAMANLADLIRQRARLIEQMQNAAAASGNKATLDVPLLPLLGAPAPSPAKSAKVTAQTSSPQTSPTRFATIAIALSALVALLIAMAVEASQHHIPGPKALQASLPEGVEFLGTVPRMKQP